MKGLIILITFLSASIVFASATRQNTSEKSYSAAGCMSCHQSDTTSTSEETSNLKQNS